MLHFKINEGEHIKYDKWTWHESRRGENKNEKKSVGNSEGKKLLARLKNIKKYMK